MGYTGFTGISELREIGQKIDLMNLWLAVFLATLAICISAYKFKLTIDLSLNKTILFKGWLQVFVKGYVLNNLIPYSGIAYRGIHLKKYYDVSYTEYTIACYIFGIVGLTLLIVSALLLISFHHHAFISITSLIVVLILIRFKFYFLKKISTIEFRNIKIKFYLKKFEGIDKQLKNILQSQKRYLFLLFFFSSLFIDFMVYGLILNSIMPKVSWYLMLYIYILYSLAWLIRLTPGNIGVQELLLGGLTSLIGFGFLSGITLSILLRLVNLFGAFFLLFLNIIKVFYK